MIIVKEDTIYIKNWDVYQSTDKLEKIKKITEEDNENIEKDKRKITLHKC